MEAGAGFGGVLLLAYWTVLTAELVGDKALYQVASLTARFTGAQVVAGITVAFALKMLIAVSLGHALMGLIGPPLDLLGAVSFFATGFLLWRKTTRQMAESSPEALHLGPAAISFGSVFLSEWADPGQIAAALLTPRSGLPAAVWIGGTAAMATKGLLAVTLGKKLRNWIPRPLLGRIATATCFLLGASSLWHAFS